MVFYFHYFTYLFCISRENVALLSAEKTTREEKKRDLNPCLWDGGSQLSKQTAYLVINLLEDECVLLIRMCTFDINFAVRIKLNINPVNHSEY